MKKIMIAIAALGIIGVATLWAQSTASKGESKEKTIQNLEARIKALEERVATLEKKQTITYVTYPSPSHNPTSLERPPTSGSVPLEFNGQTFYYVPLKGEQ